MKQLPENERKALDIVIGYSRELLRELFDKGFITQTDKKGTCPMLRRAGIDANAVAVDDNCLKCPMPRCILGGKNGSQKTPVPETADLYYQCSCGMTATLHFIGGKLEKAAKFKQVDNQIIHSCGGICKKKG